MQDRIERTQYIFETGIKLVLFIYLFAFLEKAPGNNDWNEEVILHPPTKNKNKKHALKALNRMPTAVSAHTVETGTPDISSLSHLLLRPGVMRPHVTISHTKPPAPLINMFN